MRVHALLSIRWVWQIGVATSPMGGRSGKYLHIYIYVYIYTIEKVDGDRHSKRWLNKGP